MCLLCDMQVLGFINMLILYYNHTIPASYIENAALSTTNFVSFVFRLTAFVVKSFHQAKRYIYVDTYTLEKALDWIIDYQAHDGHFPEPGHVHSTYLQVRSLIM